MSDKFQNKYRIPSARLQSWNYASEGSYFITICAAKHKWLFGEISLGKMNLSAIGELAQQFLQQIPKHFPFVELEAFVVMPKHVHGIITINKHENDGVVEENDNKIAGEQRFRNPEKHSLSSIIGSYKSVVTKHARKINPNFGWQSRFHDHIIRDHAKFVRINYYIETNVENWADDCFFNNK